MITKETTQKDLEIKSLRNLLNSNETEIKLKEIKENELFSLRNEQKEEKLGLMIEENEWLLQINELVY